MYEIVLTWRRSETIETIAGSINVSSVRIILPEQLKKNCFNTQHNPVTVLQKLRVKLGEIMTKSTNIPSICQKKFSAPCNH